MLTIEAPPGNVAKLAAWLKVLGEPKRLHIFHRRYNNRWSFSGLQGRGRGRRGRDAHNQVCCGIKLHGHFVRPVLG